MAGHNDLSFQTVDKVSKEALFFLAKNAEIWYNKVKKNK